MNILYAVLAISLLGNIACLIFYYFRNCNITNYTIKCRDKETPRPGDTILYRFTWAKNHRWVGTIYDSNENLSKIPKFRISGVCTSGGANGDIDLFEKDLEIEVLISKNLVDGF